MIVTGVTLHVGGLRHVTVHALATRLFDRACFVAREISVRHHAACIVAEHFVMAVGDGIDDWGIRRAAAVTTHAHHVAGQSNFCAVRFMAIRAAHAFVKHATAKERSDLVILIAHLSICEKQI